MQATGGTHAGSRLAVAALQILLGVFTPLALISIGGVGIYSAPFLLPLLWVVANASERAGRILFTVLGALVAAESAWAISWALVPATQLILPIGAGIGVAALFTRTAGGELPLRTALLTLLVLAAVGTAGVATMATEVGMTSETVRSKPIEVTAPPP